MNRESTNKLTKTNDNGSYVLSPEELKATICGTFCLAAMKTDLPAEAAKILRFEMERLFDEGEMAFAMEIHNALSGRNPELIETAKNTVNRPSTFS